MFRLMRSDLYRLVHERKLWLALVATVLASLVQGELVALVILVLAAVVVGEDFRTGFVKNVLVTLPRRATYVLEKYVLVALVDVVLLLVALAVRLLSSLFPGVGVPMADAVSVVLPGLLVFWLAILACSSAVVTAVLVFRSDAVGIGISLLLTSSAVGDLVSKALRTISVEPPSLVRIPNWLLASSAGLLGNGAGTPGASPAMVVPSLLAVAVCLVLSAAAIDHVEC
jgi:ABC-type transport system involved in multi-copper enzyme maturation permease subunit